MPLSKVRDRERKRLAKIRLENSKFQPKVVIAGLQIEGNRIIGIEPKFQPSYPIYNPVIHKAGDWVLVFGGKHLVEVIVPELDADGNVI